MTALQKVMNMESMAGTGDSGLDTAYKSIERLQKIAEQKQRAETKNWFYGILKTRILICLLGVSPRKISVRPKKTPIFFCLLGVSLRNCASYR